MSFRSSEDRTAKHFSRGTTLASKGQYREALKYFDKVLSIAPRHLDAINNRGNCLALLSRYEQAIASFDQLLERIPLTFEHSPRGERSFCILVG